MIDIRQCTPADLPYLYEICYKTGFNGKTAEGICEDKFQIGHYFAAPYILFNRELCFTATVNGIPKGYVIGTDNTENFTKWLNKTWLPDVRKLYHFKKMQNPNHFVNFLNSVIINETAIDERLKSYRAHLHIDLLPELQGKGMGRKLIETFFARCRDKGVEKVHLGVSKENPGAVAFYKKLGMYIIFEEEDTYMMGCDL